MASSASSEEAKERVLGKAKWILFLRLESVPQTHPLPQKHIALPLLSVQLTPRLTPPLGLRSLLLLRFPKIRS